MERTEEEWEEMQAEDLIRWEAEQAEQEWEEYRAQQFELHNQENLTL